jgi:hypothetical protein
MTVTASGQRRQSVANELYLTVLPMIRMKTGETEQVLTLTPDRKFASEFFEDEVDVFISFFPAKNSVFGWGACHFLRDDQDTTLRRAFRCLGDAARRMKLRQSRQSKREDAAPLQHVDRSTYPSMPWNV